MIKSGIFSLPGKKQLLQSAVKFEVILIDALETPIERPKKQRKYYSGKKKRHVLKSQLVVDKISQQIICTHVVTQGSVHNKKLLEISKVRLKKETKASVDSVLGLAKNIIKIPTYLLKAPSFIR